MVTFPKQVAGSGAAKLLAKLIAWAEFADARTNKVASPPLAVPQLSAPAPLVVSTCPFVPVLAGYEFPPKVAVPVAVILVAPVIALLFMFKDVVAVWFPKLSEPLGVTHYVL